MYRWIEREQGIDLKIEDESPEAVFREALVAFGDLLTEARGGEPVTHPVSLSAPDRPALLAQWMNELMRLAEADAFVPERVEKLALAGDALEADIGGQRDIPRSPLRPLSYHDLEMGTDDEGVWHAHLTFDR
jgi:SHS2 domain-containing protein